MLAEGVTILGALMIAYYQELEQNKRITSELRTSANLALIEAFHATEGYYAVLHAGGAKDLAREHEISELWDKAAIHIEPFNKYLANRLGLKSRFWREGAAWTHDQIAAAKIGLEDIRRDGRFTLMEKAARK